MDAATWARFDPAWGGESDNAVGDGRIAGWQAVFYSTSKNMGMSVVVHPGRALACVADPLTAKDRAELRNVRRFRWSTDSTEAVTAIDDVPMAAWRLLPRAAGSDRPGGWRPNPGADETVNVPYDIGGHRLE